MVARNTESDTEITRTWPPHTTRQAVTTLERRTEDIDILKLAQRYVDAINLNDRVVIEQLNCAKKSPGLLQIAANGRTVALTGRLERSPDLTRAYVYVQIGEEPTAKRMVLEMTADTWCVRD